MRTNQKGFLGQRTRDNKQEGALGWRMHVLANSHRTNTARLVRKYECLDRELERIRKRNTARALKSLTCYQNFRDTKS